MPYSVTVSTGSRLHFGPLSYGNTTGLRFGGVGMMIDAPGCRVTASPASQEEIVAADTILDLVRKIVGRFRESRPPVERDQAMRVVVGESIPRHRGFGSGTQLALAIAQALHVFVHSEPQTAETLAKSQGRGRRSAVGLHGFAHGGFLLDAGKSEPQAIGTLEEQVAFPADWAIVLITPPGQTGLLGAKEEAAFRKLKPMSEAVSAKLRHLAAGSLLPAVRNAEFELFADALFEFGATVGDFFQPVQGGRFSSPLAEGLVEDLRRLGCRGVAQSSWGPTLAVFLEDVVEAETLTAYLQSHTRWCDCVLRITTARNEPAGIVTGG